MIVINDSNNNWKETLIRQSFVACTIVHEPYSDICYCDNNYGCGEFSTCYQQCQTTT